MDSWSGTLEGSFGVELSGTIFFPCHLPGFGSISNFIFKRKKLTKLMCSQHHCVVSSIDFYITSGSHVMPSGSTFGNTFYISRWLHDIVKPSYTIRINIVCKTTNPCIVRECFGYNRVSIGRLRTCFGSTFAFYQIRDENRAKFKISYSCGHRVCGLHWSVFTYGQQAQKRILTIELTCKMPVISFN